MSLYEAFWLYLRVFGGKKCLKHIQYRPPLRVCGSGRLLLPRNRAENHRCHGEVNGLERAEQRAPARADFRRVAFHKLANTRHDLKEGEKKIFCKKISDFRESAVCQTEKEGEEENDWLSVNQKAMKPN